MSCKRVWLYAKILIYSACEIFVYLFGGKSHSAPVPPSDRLNEGGGDVVHPKIFWKPYGSVVTVFYKSIELVLEISQKEVVTL